MGPQDLTIVILTHNEVERIGGCLNSIEIPARVVIVDSFSTDGTLRRASQSWRDLKRKPGDLALVSRTWRGFTDARNASLKWVQTPWIFWLDADESFTERLNSELQVFDTNNRKYSVYRVARQSYFLGRAIRHGGWYPDRKARFGRNGACFWRPGPHLADVHEDLIARDGGERGLLKSELRHDGFRDIAEQEATNERYSTLLAEGLVRSHRQSGKGPPSRLRIWVKTAVKFMENYIFKLGILDGRPGFIIARGSAKSLHARLTKLRRALQELA